MLSRAYISLHRHAVRHPRIFVLGFREAHGDGMTYDDDPWSARSVAYDLGRNLRLLGK